MIPVLERPAAVPRNGNYMIRSVRIQNFRCFEEASLRNCQRINIVVGDNGAGKTALLEGLFLALGPSPEIATRLRRWRGFEQTLTGTFDDIEDAIWGDLFFKFDKQRKIRVELKGTGAHERSLEIEYDQSEPSVSVSTQSDAPLQSLSGLEFRWMRHDGKPITVRPRFTGNSYQFSGIENPPIPATFFASSHPFHNQENVKRFSRLSKQHAEGPMVDAFRQIFQFVDGLDIQSQAGTPMLHANVPTMPVKIPLNMISSGVNKLATLLLATSEHTDGVLLVDEIENGFHFSKMTAIWQALHKFCEHNGVQLFASTHSAECLDALATACADTPDDVSLIRIERGENGISEARQFLGSSAFIGKEIGEVR